MLKTTVKKMTTAQQRANMRKAYAVVKSSLKKCVETPLNKRRLQHFPAPYRLHLGCGNIKLTGFCNVDVMDTEAVDIMDDIRQLKLFPKNSVKEIYACHVLEHFAHHEIEPILKRWFDVLTPGGVLRISVPDIDRIVRIYHKNFPHFETPGNSPWIGLIYGGQLSPYDYHKTGFNACWLTYLLERAGFTACQEYPHEPHFVSGAADASLAKEPFGEFLSLNMMAKKPDNHTTRRS